MTYYEHGRCDALFPRVGTAPNTIDPESRPTTNNERPFLSRFPLVNLLTGAFTLLAKWPNRPTALLPPSLPPSVTAQARLISRLVTFLPPPLPFPRGFPLAQVREEGGLGSR